MLRFQDYIATATKQAADEAFRYAANVPDDQLEWSPLDKGRSVLAQCREMALTPTWAIETIEGKPHEYNEETIAAFKAEELQWTTVEQCRAECHRRMGPLLEMMRSMPDERLSDTRWLPYEGGRDFTMVEQMEYPRWNFNYHLGQIAFIQTLYGDREMY